MWAAKAAWHVATTAVHDDGLDEAVARPGMFLCLEPRGCVPASIWRRVTGSGLPTTCTTVWRSPFHGC